MYATTVPLRIVYQPGTGLGCTSSALMPWNDSTAFVRTRSISAASWASATDEATSAAARSDFGVFIGGCSSGSGLQFRPAVPVPVPGRECSRVRAARDSPARRSAARVVLPVQVFQALARDVRVDLGRREVAVTEQELHDPEVRAAIQEVRGKGVPQAVRRQLLLDARLLCVALDDVPERLAGHAIPAPGREQVVGLALQQDLHARGSHEFLEPAERLVAERDQPLAVSLAHDPEHALVEVHLRLLEVDELG